MRIRPLRHLTALTLGCSVTFLATASAASIAPQEGAESEASAATAAEPATAPAPDAEKASEPALVVSAKRVIIRPGKVLENAKVVVQDGEIIAVGTDVEVPEGATMIEGEVVCPGFLDPWSIAGVDRGSATSSAVEPSSMAVDALDPYANEFVLDRMVESGVLLARTQIGATADIGGIGAVIRASGAEVLLKDASMSAAVGVPRGGFNQGQFGNFNFGPQPVDPIDRIGQIDKLASSLASGKKYGESVAKYKVDLAEWEKAIAEKEAELEDDFSKAKKSRDKKVKDAKEKGEEVKDKKYKEDKRPRAPKHDPSKAAFARVANGEVPMVVYAERALEIRELLRVTESFDRMRLIVAGGTSALAVADMLADRGVPVIVSPSPADAGGPVGELDPGLALAGELHAAGVEVLIGSGAASGMASRDLPLLAALAVGHGLDRDAALRAITTGPARAFDVADQVGSIQNGRSADFLVLSGDPLASSSRVMTAISGGAVVHSAEQ